MIVQENRKMTHCNTSILQKDAIDKSPTNPLCVHVQKSVTKWTWNLKDDYVNRYIM